MSVSYLMAGSRIGDAEPNYYQVNRDVAPAWEVGLVSLWVLVTFVPFPGDELLLYPLALYFMASFVLRLQQLYRIALRSWILFLLPAVAAASFLWSPVASTSLRVGIMMGVTSLIAIYIGSRLMPRQIALALLLAGAVCVLMVAPNVQGAFGPGSLFGQKNIFAQRMLVVFVAGLAVGLDRQQHTVFRMLGLGLLPITFYFIIIAESATALVSALAAFAAMASVWLFWTRAKMIPHLRSMLMLTGVILVSVLMLNLLLTPSESLFAAFLESVGKDATLTGRTPLWEAAERLSAEKPWLGYGAHGFWLRDYGAAQTILEWSHKPYGTVFSFHNAYWEVRIHLGYVGYGALLITIAWSLINTVMGWFRNQDLARSFLFLMSGLVMITSFTESNFYSVFDISITIFYASAVSAIASIEFRRAAARAIRKADQQAQRAYTEATIAGGLS